jgi:DNA (cytosine-5)-methyltransferase 1
MTGGAGMRVGSLFSGAGGLDMAVEEVFGAETMWHSELDPAASKVLAYRWPNVPNLGDITRVEWSDVEPVDILCGGFPCQDVSMAGKKAGLDGHRSGLWFTMRNAIAALRPQTVVIENVLGLVTSGAIGRVLSDLSSIGYAARWTVIAAGALGAPHLRRRVFIVATVGAAAPTKVDTTDYSVPRGLKLLPTPEAKNAHAGQDFARAGRPNSGGDDLVTAVVKGHQSGWEKYRPAIAKWELLTRPAPLPTGPTSTGAPRLNPAFSEWMMGWPEGWVTAIPGDQVALFGGPTGAITRTDQLKLCGNGVVPQQAAAAIRALSACEVAA